MIDNLADFPAVVCRVKSMVDKGIRVEFDLPETETGAMARLHEISREGTVIRVVIYDDDQFMAAVREQTRGGQR